MIDSIKTPGQLLFEKLAINFDEVPFEQLVHYIAVEYFLTVEDDAPSDASNLGKVNRYLESFHHLCEVKDWNRANQVITYHLDISNQYQLHSKLGIWGYYKEQINIYTRLVNKLNKSTNFTILKGLGNAYKSLSEYGKAINYFNQSLLIAEEIQDKIKQAEILRDLGIVYSKTRKYHKALTYLTRALKIVQVNISLDSTLGNNLLEIHELQEIQKLEASILGNFGNIYGYKRNFHKSIKYLQQSLKIAQEVGDRETENYVFNNLGNIYSHQKEYTLAISCLNQYSIFTKQSEHRFNHAKALRHLGHLYILSKEYLIANDLLHGSLAISKDIGDREGQSVCLLNLGDLYGKQGYYEEAIRYFRQSLILAKEIGNNWDIVLAKVNLLLASFRFYIKGSFIKQDMTSLNNYN